MTSRNDMTDMINAARGKDLPRFDSDYDAVFGISDEQLDRILERAATAEEFFHIWENETWWV